MAKSILHDSFRRVVSALNNIADSIIVWPQNDRLTAVKNRFSEIGVLPNVIGAIDGSHIPILAPHVKLIFLCYFHYPLVDPNNITYLIFMFLFIQLHSESYRTKKCEYALTLQAVCTAGLVFTDCFVVFAGSVNDSRIFRNSDLWMSVEEKRANFFFRKWVYYC